MWTPDDYHRYIMMSTKRHILVEGRDDKRLFKVLLGELLGESAVGSVEIDTAQQLIGFYQTTENREKIEAVNNKIVDKPFSSKLACFVDREFRDFDLVELRDTLAKHRVSGRLVWSRGHSIENYLLDFDTLRDPFLTLSPDYDTEATTLFSVLLNSALKVACAISMAAKDCDRLRAVRSCLGKEALEIGDLGVSVRLSHWRTQLALHLSENHATRITERFLFWEEKLSSADTEVTRWMCDGHTGFIVVCEVFALCLAKTGKPNSLQTSEQLRKYLCIHSWARRLATKDHDQYPSEVFTLLGLTSVMG